jgi:presqualene diphosphate synthase
MSLSAASPPTAQARASGSSFYAAMRILPCKQRQAMFEIYAFCRAVDDIADEGGDVAARRAALDAWRTDIAALCAGKQPPAQLAALGNAIHAFALERDDFFAVIDGMEMDVVADIQAPDWATLNLYCDRVACAVGRLSVRIFGVPKAEGLELAHHLGRASQLTNILRDLDEDAAMSRLYLPREALAAAGVLATAPRDVLADPRLGSACAPVIARAREHFAQATNIMARCPRASVRAPGLMGEVYQAILAAVVARGFAPPRGKVRVPKRRILLALLRHGLL